MNDSFDVHFQAMLQYRVELFRQGKKNAFRKIKMLYGVLKKNKSTLLNLAQQHLGYSVTESIFTTLFPLLQHYKICKKNIDIAHISKSAYSTFIRENARYQLHNAEGILLIGLCTCNPIYYVFASIFSLVMNGNSAVFYFDAAYYTADLVHRLQSFLRPIFSEQEIIFLHSKDSDWGSLKKLPFHKIYTFDDAPILKTTPLPAVGAIGNLQYAVVAEKVAISSAMHTIYYANSFNAGYSPFHIDTVFIHQPLYEECVKKLLQIDKVRQGKPYKCLLRNKTALAATKMQLKQLLNEDYRILNATNVTFTNEAPLSTTEGYFPPTIVEKVNPLVADTFKPFSFLNPILPLIPFSRLEDLMSSLNNLIYRYRLFIFSRERLTVNRVIQQTDGMLYQVNHIFSETFSTLSPYFLPYQNKTLVPFVQSKYILMNVPKTLTPRFLPPFTPLQEQYLRIQLMHRFR